MLSIEHTLSIARNLSIYHMLSADHTLSKVHTLSIPHSLSRFVSGRMRYYCMYGYSWWRSGVNIGSIVDILLIIVEFSWWLHY